MNTALRTLWPALLLASQLLNLPAGQASELLELPEGQTMGTTYHIRVVGPAAERSTELQTEIDRLLLKVNQQMSTYDPESEVSRFNAYRGTDSFPVSSHTARVTARALEISALSGGAFDPTVGPLVELWNFGKGRMAPRIPTDAEIAERQKRVGYENLHVQLDPPALQKDLPDLEVDLSAIAKGFGVDVCAEWLVTQPDITGGMVEIGGEVRTFGSKPDGTPWRISILKPVEHTVETYRVVELESESLATSGNYRNFFEIGGVRYSHTIDPTTGRPVTHQLVSVSVLAEDCMTADGMATALTVMGFEKGLALAERLGLATYLIAANDGQLIEQSSTAAVGRFQPPPAPAAEPVTGDSPWLTVLLTIIVFAIALCGLGIGVILSNRQLKGTCGGLQGLKDASGQSMCELCKTPKEECEEFRKQIAQTATGSNNEPPEAAG